MEKFAGNILLLLTVLILQACETNKPKYTSKPTKSLINPDSELLEVNAVAYHTNDSATAVYLEIKNENLVYKRPDTTLAFYAELKISYKLLPEAGSRKLLDSNSYSLLDRAAEKVDMKSVLSRFNLMTLSGNNYYLDIQVLDVNKKTKYRKGLNIYKQNRVSSQNFLMTLNGDISFKNNFLKGDEVVVRFSNKAISQVTVDCFFREFGPAKPPFSLRSPEEFNYRPDSTFAISVTGNQYVLTMPERGFYHVRTESESGEGITLYTYDKTFPGVSNSNEMINCTRYIMNKAEFEECKNAVDQKAAIDKFWLTVGGSNERARELLKSYYGRVKGANKDYSSYTQGWKSDRGMIYIIFGPAVNTYHNSKEEIWVYGAEGTASAKRYVFRKNQNPFTDNDYILERSQFFQDPWYLAVDYWRQGHIYLDNRKH